MSSTGVNCHCNICFREFAKNGPEGSIEYRRNILHTGATHLFDELIEWSSINVNDTLPFCPSCIESVEKTSSLSDGYNLLQKEVEYIVDSFTMDTLRNRKAVRTRGELLSKTPIKIEPGSNEKSNCVICYKSFTVQEEMMSIQQKVTIGKTCQKYLLPGILRNDVGFSWPTLPLLNFKPFCTQCCVRVDRVVQLNQKLEQAKEDLRKFVDEFCLDCFKRQKSNKLNSTSDNTWEIRTEDVSDMIIGLAEYSGNEAIPPDGKQCPEILNSEDNSFDDPSNLHTVTGNLQTGNKSYFVEDSSSPLSVNANCFLTTPQTGKTTFTVNNLQTHDSHSQAMSCRPFANSESSTSSDFQDSLSQMNDRSATGERVDDGELLVPDVFQPFPKEFSEKNSDTIGDKPDRTCSSCNKTFQFKCRLIAHQIVNKTCSSFFNNLSRNSVKPTLKCSPKVSSRSGLKCTNCPKVFKNRKAWLHHKKSCLDFFSSSSDKSHKKHLNNSVVQIGIDNVDKYYNAFAFLNQASNYWMCTMLRIMTMLTMMMMKITFLINTPSRNFVRRNSGMLKNPKKFGNLVYIMSSVGEAVQGRLVPINPSI